MKTYKYNKINLLPTCDPARKGFYVPDVGVVTQLREPRKITNADIAKEVMRVFGCNSKKPSR